jgi:hypothetical protein
MALLPNDFDDLYKITIKKTKSHHEIEHFFSSGMEYNRDKYVFKFYNIYCLLKITVLKMSSFIHFNANNPEQQK